MAITANRLWVALVGVAILAFAGCAVGAVDCTVFKPVGLTATFGAAFVSFFDPGAPARDGATVDE